MFDTKYFTGTTKNCILEGSAIKKTFKIAVWGHSGKLEGIASHPDDLGNNHFTIHMKITLILIT